MMKLNQHQRLFQLSKFMKISNDFHPQKYNNSIFIAIAT